MPDPADMVQFAPGTGQRFIVTVDTEEEFDWTRPLDRTSHGLDHVPLLAKFQQFCEGLGVSPVYLVDSSMYVFRAWHSLPDDFQDVDGNPVNAV